MKRVLITGENSYVGKSLFEFLKLTPEKYSVDFVSLRDNKWKAKVFSKYDVIIHLAAIVHQNEKDRSYEEYININCDLTKELAEKSKKDGVEQFIFFSTMNVFGVSTGNIDKNTPLKPKSYYGKSKLKAEKELLKLQNNKFKIVIIRPPMIYGEKCVGNFDNLLKLSKITPFFPHVINYRSMIYIDNLILFTKKIIDNQEEGIFHPQNNEYVTTTFLVEKISKYTGKRIIFIKGFSQIISFLNKYFNLSQKIFGNLTYDFELSRYHEQYCIKSFEQSIEKTIKNMR